MSNHDSYFHLKKKIKKIPCGQPPFPSCCPALLCAVFAAIQLLPGLDRKTCSRSEVSGLAWLHSALSYWLKMGLRVRNTYTFPCLVLPPPPPQDGCDVLPVAALLLGILGEQVGACFSSPRSAWGISFPINPLDLPRSQHVSSIAPYPFPPCSSLLGALSCFIAHVQHGTAPSCSDCVAYTAVWDPFTTQPHFPHSSPNHPFLQ